MVRKEKFKTSRGARVEMSKESIKQMYGEKYAVENGERNLDYFYDSISGKDLESMPALNQNDSINTYIFSAVFDSNEGSVEHIHLIDMRMAVYLS
jgi:hypothetical protein